MSAATYAAQLLTTSVEALHLELGCPTSLMPVAIMECCAMDSWLTSLWETCNKWNIATRGIAPELTRAQVCDQFIVQAFAWNKNISEEQLRVLNKCRCFLEALTLADIVTVCGPTVEPEALEGKNAHPLYSYN